MEEIVTLSRETPSVKSMDYKFLKEEGIRRIQELAGSIWTDYNEHDPGVTLLEALCYALTDLGYRTTFDMKDLLAPNPEDGMADEYSFFTARQILHNNPVTIQDFRKLLMDVSLVIDPDGNPVSGAQASTVALEEDKEIIGVKNAWIEEATGSEKEVFPDPLGSKLSYTVPEGGSTETLDMKVLYNAVLEFSDSAFLGDLNLDTLEEDFPIYAQEVIDFIVDPENIPDEPSNEYDLKLFENLKNLLSDDQERAKVQEQTEGLRDVQVKVNVEFPRWDEANLNWQDLGEIKRAIKNVTITFIGMPHDMEIIYRLDDGILTNEGTPDEKLINDIMLASGREDMKDRAVPFLEDITNRINCLVVGNTDSMLRRYQNKVLAILMLLDKAKARLNAHRNIGEDFLNFSALRVEEIRVCADVEVEANANINEVEGHIFYLLDRFLSPTINFYTLDEILQKDLQERKYDIQKINIDERVITLASIVEQELLSGDTISLSGFGEQVLTYTVQSVGPNQLNERLTDITVQEELANTTRSEDSFVFIGDLNEEKTRLVEDIFEGPALENGFIDNAELEGAERMRFIRASDIMNLIMDVEGVVAVKTLQIANDPIDDNPEIESRSVKWCLQLAVDQNYVPRLTRESSRMTYFKGELPFTAATLGAEEVFEELKAAEKPAKPSNPALDLPIPQGEYRELSEYTSVQDDLPLIYGVGPEGIPMDTKDENEIRLRKIQARQLKGFLMIFDQLLANYLEQLEHVKHLFSYNPLRKPVYDENHDPLPKDYNFQVDRTYYAQPIQELVANSVELYFSLNDSDNPVSLTEEQIRSRLFNELQPITEDRDTFQVRRNKFLDHLLGRYAEQFTDYALLAYRLNEPATDLELIEDKQDFLSRYPDISANRGKAFDYKDPLFWYLDNASGLEKRSSFLTGIDPTTIDDLAFDPSRIRTLAKAGGRYGFEVIKDQGNGDLLVLRGREAYSTARQFKEAVEKIILYGVRKENFSTRCVIADQEKRYVVVLLVEGVEVAAAVRYNKSEEEAQMDTEEFVRVFQEEFFENPLANRKNLSLPFNAYFTGEISGTDISTQSYNIKYSLFDLPYQFEEDQRLLSGTLQGEVTYQDDTAIDEQRLEREINEAAQKAIQTTYWDIVYFGGRLCLYEQSGDDDLVITDRVGDEIARGSVARINELLAHLELDLSEDKVESDLSEYQKAANRLTTFFERTFFRQEGLHLLEHILLRPKINNVWVTADNEDVKTIPEQDVFIPVREELTKSLMASVVNGEVHVNGNLKDKLGINMELTVTSDTLGEQVVRIATFSVDSELNQTVLTVSPSLPTNFEGESDLKLHIKRMVQVVDISDSDPGQPPFLELKDATDYELLYLDPDLLVEKSDKSTDRKQIEIRLTDIKDTLSYGTFRVDEVPAVPEPPGVELGQFKLQDRLLPIYIPNGENDIVEPEEECDDCKMENPYSFIAQVAVAGWPGRFDNIDFRDFFERTLQLESPAHLFLNICWIGYDQMETFERRYKRWILANLKDTNTNRCEGTQHTCSLQELEALEELSNAQNELVEILYDLRNVYPVKTLHDCGEDESTEGAIILNQTALGEI